MKAEVFLTSSTVTEDDVKDRTVVVIDVLRASSTIATALNNWARAIVPVADTGSATKIASNLDQSSYLLGGERGGIKIEGYHLGNSPLEYTAEAVEGRTIIFTTTNGTVAISRASAAEHLIVGSFLNAERVVEFTRQAGLDVTIICGGWRNRVALEDTLCAGLLLHRLWEGHEPDVASDSAHIAYSQYVQDKENLADALRRSNHAKWLTANGYADDVDYCLQVDVLPVLPYYKENRLVLYQTHEHESVL